MKDQIISKLLEYLEMTNDTTLSQIPDVILQALRYEKTSAWVSVGLMSALMTAGVSLGWYVYSCPILDENGSRDLVSVGLPIITVMLSPLFFVQLCSSADKLLKLYCAPKLYLIQLLASINK